MKCLCGSKECKGTLGQQAQAALAAGTVHSGETPSQPGTPASTGKSPPLGTKIAARHRCEWVWNPQLRALRRVLLDFVSSAAVIPINEDTTVTKLRRWLDLTEFLPEQWCPMIKDEQLLSSASATTVISVVEVDMTVESIALEDFLSLQPTKMIHSDVMNVWARMLENETQGQTSRSPKVIYLTSHFFQILRISKQEDGEWGFAGTSTTRWKLRHKISVAEWIVFPICNRAHWTILVAHTESTTIFRFDSLCDKDEADAKMAALWLNWKRQSEGSEPAVWRVHHNEVERQLRGSNDCRITVLGVMYNVKRGLIEQQHLPRAIHGNAMRKWCAWIVVRGGIVCEKPRVNDARATRNKIDGDTVESRATKTRFVAGRSRRSTAT
eukprot:1859574-Rhodomonas_salina.3